MGKSRIETVLERRTDQKKAVAVERSLAALSALERAGIAAWIVGSLVKGGFSFHSDVDVLVQCSPEEELRAFKIVEAAMHGFPFHLIPTCNLDEEALSSFFKEAVDASGVRACA